MARDRLGPDPDRLIVAGLIGAAQRHANWHELTEAETAAAAAELQEMAGCRADLLAEVAGVALGFHAGDLNEPKAKAIAQLCVAAGADKALIPQWIAEGKRRAEAARQKPGTWRPAP